MLQAVPHSRQLSERGEAAKQTGPSQDALPPRVHPQYIRKLYADIQKVASGVEQGSRPVRHCFDIVSYRVRFPVGPPGFAAG